jgi:predicted enzyme related to lactoylglutathione lyase
MGAPVVWFEFGGRNGQALQQFYSELFEWKIDANNPLEYGTVDTNAGGAGVPGGVWAAGDKPGAELGDYVTVFVAVPDIDDAVARGERLGAKAIVAKWEIPEGPTVAYLRDPEGHLFALIQMADAS